MKNNMKDLMLLRGISQTELAKRSNVSRPLINKLYNQKDSANPSYDKMVAISEVLNYSVYDVFFNENIEIVLKVSGKNDDE